MNEKSIERTICSCDKCSIYCKIMPGNLIPSDFAPILNFLWGVSQPIEDFIKQFFRASPGATVLIEGKIIQIPTIVPARNEITNECIFLVGSSCLIHDISPWGCRMFDSHMSKEEADKRSEIGLYQIMKSKPYKNIHDYLFSHNLISKSAEELRKELNEI